jgi:hypothetical protein
MKETWLSLLGEAQEALTTGSRRPFLSYICYIDLIIEGRQHVFSYRHRPQEIVADSVVTCNWL